MSMTPDPQNCPLCGCILIRDPVVGVLICPECQLDFESAVTIKAKREYHEETMQGTQTPVGNSSEEPNGGPRQCDEIPSTVALAALVELTVDAAVKLCGRDAAVEVMCRTINSLMATKHRKDK